MSDYKNALPSEVDDHPDSDDPRELRTRAENERPLSRAEAEVAGLIPGTGTSYGESSMDAGSEARRDEHHAEPGEHF